jgi:hypothetical protein
MTDREKKIINYLKDIIEKGNYKLTFFAHNQACIKIGKLFKKDVVCIVPCRGNSKPWGIVEFRDLEFVTDAATEMYKEIARRKINIDKQIRENQITKIVKEFKLQRND